MTLLPSIWRPEELDQLLHRIQMPLTVGLGLSWRAVGREYPGVYPWYLTRWWVLPVATVALILILAISISLLTSR